MGRFNIRDAVEADEPALSALIRTVMPEFGANGPGFALHDAEVDHMYTAYAKARHAFFVVEEGDQVVGGGGYGPLAGADASVCELRKMYFYPQVRGHGMGRELLSTALDRARHDGFTTCYLETLTGMDRAAALYEAAGFEWLDKPMGVTGHCGCNRWMAKSL